MASSDPQVERDVTSSGYESPNETNQSSYFPPSTTGPAAVVTAAPSPGTPNVSQRQRPPMSPGSGSRGQVEPNIPRMRPQGSNGSSLNRMLAANQNQRSPSGKVSLRDRIACHQWTWFAMVSTSQEINGCRLTGNRQWCANLAAVHRDSHSNDYSGNRRPCECAAFMFVLATPSDCQTNLTFAVSYRGPWLDGVGVAIFLFNICLFIMNCVLISIRFHLRPGSFMNAFTDQTESLFIPSFVSKPPHCKKTRYLD
jgi:voltage-gated anion channel